MRVVKSPEKGPESLTEAVSEAIRAMAWLTPADAAMVALAIRYAEQIDAAEDAKTLGWIGQNLAATLKALGGSPAERKALGIEERTRGKLAAMRSAR